MASDDQILQRCFHEWMAIQEQELNQLLQALNQNENGGDDLTETSCAQLTEKSINSFQEYIDKRAQLSRLDISGLFSPSWNTALENSLLWVAGCRPSMYIRLTYALCGSQVEFQLSEIIQRLARGNLGEISAAQLRMINDLHMKTIKEEEKLSNKLAGLQENIADQPIAIVAKRMSRVGETSGEVDHALDEHESSMANILQEADKLRLSTLKELLSILTPLQGVDFLVASKKLHLFMHEWGKTRDNRHGLLRAQQEGYWFLFYAYSDIISAVPAIRVDAQSVHNPVISLYTCF
ncbi:transcription factor TGA5 [Gossypium australe]|uniref:Transcription factor TGA5 n=1 Tax=Gossypium australe TaxID=47621 RepID=A0A5B6WLM1_9ROSI|nr:transcription factor TGA5 [Gossypium australe]